ncbi:tetratricopeptide repeat protein [Fusobacterium polymorphum]|uniref:tetratricopeptide repeat protein n=1 Tax=Fusobacterium nucleatum subsp. polymorphum TaxID=76857 RepID=UPI00300ADC1D
MDEKEKEKLLKKIEEYTKKIEKEPNNDIYYNNKGVTFNNLEEFDKAIEDYSQAINLNSNNASYYNNRGVAFDNLEKYEKAIEDYSQAINLNSNNASYYNNRGDTYYNLKEYEKAIEDYNKVIELEPNDASYYNKRANTYYSLKKYEKAIEDCSQAINLEPNYLSYTYLAKIFYTLKKYDNALENCNKAIELCSEFSVLFTNRGKVYSKQKKYKESIKDYDKAIKLDANEEAKELKEIISNYLDGNFKKTKESINSYRKKYKIRAEKYQTSISFEELSSIKDFLENTQKKLEGYLTFADILGWKGIWKKQNSDEGKIDTLDTLLFIKSKLEEEFKDEKGNYKINLISDTYVVFAKNFQINNKLSKRLIELCLKNDLLIRGATSYGKFYNNDMVYIGQTVDEAASWHEMGEEIGIFYTSSAKLSIDEENPIEYELKNSYLRKGTIKTKLGEIKTYYINWYNKETKKDFYRIMKDEVISPDISSKYLNTEKSMEKHLNVKSNKILRSNKYVKNR